MEELTGSENYSFHFRRNNNSKFIAVDKKTCNFGAILYSLCAVRYRRVPEADIPSPKNVVISAVASRN
jgi:hypothetical protein